MGTQNRLSVARCCCGTSSCDIGSDDFNRADNTSLGSDWTEDSGSWSIASNKLYTASTSAEATYQTAHPDSEAQHVVNVKIDFTTNGDKARIIMEDVVFEIVYATSGNYTVNFYYDSGASLERSVTGGYFNPALIMPVTAVYRRDQSKAVILIDEECEIAWIDSSPSTYKVGLGTGDTNSGGVSFEDFEYGKAASATNTSCGDLACGPSCAYCADSKTDDPLLILPTGIAAGAYDDASGFNGTQLALIPGLTFSASPPSTFYGATCTWGGLFEFCSGGYLAVEAKYEYRAISGKIEWYIQTWAFCPGYPPPAAQDYAVFRLECSTGSTIGTITIPCTDSNVDVPYSTQLGSPSFADMSGASIEVNP